MIRRPIKRINNFHKFIITLNSIIRGDFFMKNEFIKSVLKGTLLGLAVIFLCIFIFALLMTLLDLSASFSFPLSMVALGIGSFVSGLVSGKSIKEKGLLIGLYCGVIYLIVFSVTSLFSGSADFTSVLLRFLCSVIPSLAGGVFGVNSNSKSNFKI